MFDSTDPLLMMEFSDALMLMRAGRATKPGGSVSLTRDRRGFIYRSVSGAEWLFEPSPDLILNQPWVAA